MRGGATHNATISFITEGSWIIDSHTMNIVLYSKIHISTMSNKINGLVSSGNALLRVQIHIKLLERGVLFGKTHKSQSTPKKTLPGNCLIQFSVNCV